MDVTLRIRNNSLNRSNDIYIEGIILTMVKGRRGQFYRYDDKYYPSVTSILTVINKPALLDWAAKTAAQNVLMYPEEYSTVEKAKASIYITRDDAAGRGTEAHTIAEAYVTSRILGQTKELDVGQLNPFYESIDNFFEIMKPKVLFLEKTLINTKEEYAGTADLIAEMSDGNIWVIDYKTSKAVYAEYSLQVEAYRNCDKMIMPDNTLVDAPKATKTAIVLFKTDGTFEFQEVKGDFDAFLAAKRLWEWKQKVDR